MLSAAVERQFEIIGEALVRLRRIAPEAAKIVPDLRRIVGFRNENDLPRLQEAVANLLRSAPTS